MKHRALIVLLILAAALCVQGCGRDTVTVRGSGNVVEEERSVSGFSGVRLDGIGTVTIELGDQEALRIEAEDNLLEYFETKVRNGILRIEKKENTNLRPREPISFYLTAKTLNVIALSGSGEIRAPSLSVERFSVNVSGSGGVAVEDLEAESLEVDIDGSGDVNIAAGEVEKQDVTVNGSGEYNARDVQSATADVNISGSGTVTVWVRDDLRVNLDGSGHVRYTGDPTLDSDVSGSGDIKRIGRGDSAEPVHRHAPILRRSRKGDSCAKPNQR
jgi:hypothetical protein